MANILNKKNRIFKMTPSPHITRKEIADQLGVSIDMIERKEKVWGLDKLRSGVCQKPILYWRRRTVARLSTLGFLAE